ncbi:MAG: hypothetical protein FWC51_02095 [Proteobacteria bacterium]|nr:hypothetical protein [Pseudomonadota bacterium]
MNMNTCPFFGKCGGCGFDVAAANYRDIKLSVLKHIPTTQPPVWINPGTRRRADFSVNGGKFGFFAGHSNDIVPVCECPILTPALNKTLPAVAALPWVGSAGVLMTECANGIDINITSRVPYYSPDFARAAAALPVAVIRATWNGKDIFRRMQPFIEFANARVPFPAGAFLQPSVAGENALRELIGDSIAPTQESLSDKSPSDSIPPPTKLGAGKVLDLFCGLGAFTLPFGATGFDNFAPGIDALNDAARTPHLRATVRDLFKRPLSARELTKYNAVIMDPPRAGAESQCREIATTQNIRKVAYVSCSPETFMRDAKVLESGGYQLTTLTPVDQFAGSTHWELVGIFER